MKELTAPAVSRGEPADLRSAVMALVPERGVLMLARDAPGEVTAAHTHPTPETLVVVEGEITFRAGEVEVTCRPGDRFLLPAETPHESVAGPDGCLYLIATRLIEAAG